MQSAPAAPAAPVAPAAAVAEVPLSVERDALGGWAPLVDEFRESVRVTGHAARTAYLYGHYVSKFCWWLLREGVTAPASITPTACMSFQRLLYYQRSPRGGESPVSSQIAVLTGVRSFTRFLKRGGYALVDPGQAIEMPRRPKRLPREVFSEEEMTRLLSLPDVRTLKGYRDRAILELLYGTGLRAGEIVGLDVEDVDLSTGRVQVREGKGGKDRVVPMGGLATEYVGGYIAHVRRRYARSHRDQALFVGIQGRRLAQKVLQKIVAYYTNRAGIERHVSPHTFRHTCATHMLRGGANIRQVQEMLGHESIVTTERYTRVEIGDLAEVHARFHPRERM